MTTTQHERFVSLLTRETLALVLAGGRGERLKALTEWRAKPAVHYGGKFRLIDFPLSNCVNSGIRRVGVLTQYKAHSLIWHVQQGWGFLRGHLGEFIEIIPAQQRIETSWYVGTADAVYQNLDIIRGHQPEYVLILAGDHAYKMDYGPMLADHVERGADVSIACLEVPRMSATSLGVMTVDEDDRIVRFTEKPEDPEPIPGDPERALGSLGIYVFKTDVLEQVLREDAAELDSSHDFGKDVIPGIIDRGHAHAYRFVDPTTGEQAYWRDVGTVDAFWESNLELVEVSPPLNLYDRDWPIWTFRPQVPPAKFVFDEDGRRGTAIDSMVSGGCIVSGSTVKHSLLFTNVRVHSYSTIRDSVILPDVDVGRSCRITRAIVDRWCRLPPKTVIGEDGDEDARRFYVSDGGVVVVTPEMLGQSRTGLRQAVSVPAAEKR